MSPDRSRSQGREAVPSSSSDACSSQQRNISMRLPPPHLCDHRAYRSRPYPQPVVGGRSMHQIQLELEYDAEESDNDSDRRPMMPRWPSALERHQALDDQSEQAVRQIHALCTFDEVGGGGGGSGGGAPTNDGPRSAVLDAVTRLPVLRKWGRWRWRGHPKLGNIHVREAVAIYERGHEQASSQRCSRCRTGQGVSPACVVAPETARVWGEPTACSNCIYDGIGYACDVAGRNSQQHHHQGAGNTTEPLRDPDMVVDHMAVLEMIAALKRPSGSRRDQSLPSKAKRIEMAALHIAQAARAWGEKMEERH